jgi:glycine cleavage system aminomethyltransferase T
MNDVRLPASRAAPLITIGPRVRKSPYFDATPFVELLTPRDLSRCPSHQCLCVLLTDQRGRIVNDAVLMHLRDNEFWLSPGDGDALLWAQGVATQSGIEVAGEPIPGNESFWPVLEAGTKPGHVSRCVFSPRLERTIGFANVPATHSVPGTRLTTDAPGPSRRATVVKAPWFPAQRNLPTTIRN